MGDWRRELRARIRALRGACSANRASGISADRCGVAVEVILHPRYLLDRDVRGSPSLMTRALTSHCSRSTCGQAATSELLSIVVDLVRLLWLLFKIKFCTIAGQPTTQTPSLPIHLRLLRSSTAFVVSCSLGNTYGLANLV